MVGLQHYRFGQRCSVPVPCRAFKLRRCRRGEELSHDELSPQILAAFSFSRLTTGVSRPLGDFRTAVLNCTAAAEFSSLQSYQDGRQIPPKSHQNSHFDLAFVDANMTILEVLAEEKSVRPLGRTPEIHVVYLKKPRIFHQKH